MFRKIILPVVLLIFTQQDFYGMKISDKNNNNTFSENKWWEWKTINDCVNVDTTKEGNQRYPKLWLLWAFLDNIPFQYGGSKIWKHGEAYCGLSNGIGFFPSILNFGWLKIGIGDAHVNVINLILVGFKYFVRRMFYKPGDYSLLGNILYTLCYNFVITGIHLLSFNFLNCVKVKIISIGMVIGFFTNVIRDVSVEKNWYHTCFNSVEDITDICKDMSRVYLFLSPRIEINISGIINYFKCK